MSKKKWVDGVVIEDVKTIKEPRQRPTVTSSNPSKDELRDYALYRQKEFLTEMRAVIKRNQDEGIYTEDEDYRDPLAISAGHVITIELSTGGDADGIKLFYDADYCLTGGVYYWADWGVYEEVKLDIDEAREIANYYCIEAENFVS